MSGVVSLEKARPTQLAHLSDRIWTEVTIGKSAASVWRIEAGDGPALFVKTAPVRGPNPIVDEVARLEWLGIAGFPAPRILDLIEADDLHWLVMTAVPGADLTSLVLRPAELCAVMADALRRLHALDAANCPFDHSLPHRLKAAAANVSAGWVDEQDFEDEHMGWSADAVLDWTRRHQPSTHDLVLTHGDACLPNVMALDGRFSGIIDCGRLGIADRWQDLALACSSIAHNCGRDHVETFLDAYEAEWDEERYRYYCVLDEMF